MATRCLASPSAGKGSWPLRARTGERGSGTATAARSLAPCRMTESSTVRYSARTAAGSRPSPAMRASRCGNSREPAVNNQPDTPSPADPGGAPVLAAELLHDGRVSVDDERHIVAALSACGVAAQAKVIPPRRDAQTLTWLLLISVPLQGFLSAVGEKVAADA